MIKIKDSCGDMHVYTDLELRAKVISGNGELIVNLLEGEAVIASFFNPIYFLEQ